MLVQFILSLAIVSVALASTKTIEAYYPKKLSSLYLRGDGCGLNWDTGIKMTMSSIANGFVWSFDLNCAIMPSALELKVLVDDETWMIGSNHHVSNAALKDTSSPDKLFPWFYTYQGSLKIHENIYSSELKNVRDVIVYTPPSYLENTLKVHQNVLIMHDGQNLFDPRTSAFGTAWMCQNTMNDVIVGGKSDEVILVGAYNTVDRNNEYTYIYDPSEGFGGKGDLYLDWIESTLIPFVKSNYRVSWNRDKIGILGSSLGGLISCYAGYTRSSVYGKAGCMSSSFWWDDQDYQKHVIVEHRPDANVSLPVFYMDSGTSGSLGGEAQCGAYTAQIYDYYVANVGYTAEENVFKYVDQGGEHNEASWGARFYMPIQTLFPPDTV